MAGRLRCALVLVCTTATLAWCVSLHATSPHATGLGIDVDFYTGPISHDVWNRIKRAGQRFAIAQAWGGRSMNEFAASQLSGARSVGMRTGAYILLNYDDKVCPTFASPVRGANGTCLGDLVSQSQPGSRWQVRQGLAALGGELTRVAFVAIDVEWFLSAAPPSDPAAQQRRRQSILDALDEVATWRKQPVIYTRNSRRHWFDITGCPNASQTPDCDSLYAVVRHPRRPVPLWDVEDGDAALDGFQPHGAWTSRVGRQYKLDQHLFGLPPDRTIDLNVFDLSLFSTASSARR